MPLILQNHFEPSSKKVTRSSKTRFGTALVNDLDMLSDVIEEENLSSYLCTMAPIQTSSDNWGKILSLQDEITNNFTMIDEKMYMLTSCIEWSNDVTVSKVVQDFTSWSSWCSHASSVSKDTLCDLNMNVVVNFWNVMLFYHFNDKEYREKIISIIELYKSGEIVPDNVLFF